MFIIAVILELILGFTYIFYKRKNVKMARTWKTLASIGFVLLGILAYSKQPSNYGAFILIGLILGGIGDFFLANQYCDVQRKDVYFILGLASFMFGHVAYSYAFYPSHGIGFIQMSCFCLGLAFVTYLLLQKMKLDFGKMKLPVIFYCAIIYFMEFQALQYLVQSSISAYVLNIGTLLFVLSDLILAFIYFRKMNSELMNRWNLSCYYLAQIFIVIHLYVSFA